MKDSVWRVKQKPKMKGLKWSILGALYIILIVGLAEEYAPRTILPSWSFLLPLCFVLISPFIWFVQWAKKKTASLEIVDDTMRFRSEGAAIALSDVRVQLGRNYEDRSSSRSPRGTVLCLEEITGNSRLCILGVGVALETREYTARDTYGSQYDLSMKAGDFQDLLNIVKEKVSPGHVASSDDSADSEREHVFEASPGLMQMGMTSIYVCCSIALLLGVSALMDRFFSEDFLLRYALFVRMIFLPPVLYSVWRLIGLIRQVQKGHGAGTLTFGRFGLIYRHEDRMMMSLRLPFQNVVALRVYAPRYSQSVSMAYCGPGIELQGGLGGKLRILISDAERQWKGSVKDVNMMWDCTISVDAGDTLVAWLATNGIDLGDLVKE
jgi:hypothetical protein